MKITTIEVVSKSFSWVFNGALLSSVLIGCYQARELWQVSPYYVVQDAPPYVVQPDYNGWRSVKIGMTEEEVESNLGKPLSKGIRPTDNEDIECYLWNYGEIDFKTYTVPHQYQFELLFKRGCVVDKWDPFEGDLSTDGKPTMPKPMFPLPDQHFDHFPRFIDFRWRPSSGQYPMEYEIEVQTDVGDMWDGQIAQTRHPYYPYAYGGKGRGRWRIRATNALGTSNWTDWLAFQFNR